MATAGMDDNENDGNCFIQAQKCRLSLMLYQQRGLQHECGWRSTWKARPLLPPPVMPSCGLKETETLLAAAPQMPDIAGTSQLA
ncbi:hypothetical protein BCV69DRAFT_285217 [Microstroma glucosiphilum]|uniref:Uncharacterized protein n=1 Tax=Pseudomicrostroma glucosiphilum TaxID=1684307 RepID=A0A316U5K2_9BASI|nr:hypothetical protein BCV69DRAFT_285217 [Pseudomicrostroma glucosiphilum]PWN18235.1 hypothetical protein BCV69DRAFT_285217 [Pseudomicrostroma glucosiphilum]